MAADAQSSGRTHGPSKVAYRPWFDSGQAPDCAEYIGVGCSFVILGGTPTQVACIEQVPGTQ